MKSLPRHCLPARHALRALPALMLAAFATTAQAAATPAWVGVAAHAHDPRNAVHVGPLRAGTPVHVSVSLQVRNKAQLDALTNQLIAGTPGAKPLTAAEFAARHAPTPAQAQAVVDYLHAKGFINVEVADNRLIVTADGVAATVKGAFGADLHEYDIGGRSAYANVTDARVPAQLQSIILGVGGLQTVHLAHVNAKAAAFTSAPDVAQLQAAITGVSPTAFASIYGAANLPVGSNATIGIVTVGSTTQTITDLKNFASKAGYPAPPVSTVTINGGSNSTSGVSEWNMDSQSSLAAAGGTIKSMVLYTTRSFSDSDLAAAYNKAMSDNKTKVISVSIGGCETDMSTLSTDNQTFQSAIAQGQTFAFATGDSGAYECGATAGKAQSWPAASPYVMAIGGTTLSTNNGNTWAGETVWSCTSASNCQHDSAGGAGGGPSLTQTASTAQRNSGVLGNSTARGLPDVSFDAAPSSGGLILVNGANQQWGGTSLATPIFAGLWARIQSNNGNTLAFPAATLYGGASAHPEWFHDVTSGNQGYAAAVGWDYATGYGSLQTGNFATAFSGTTPTGPAANFTAATSGLTATFTDSSTDSSGTINAYAWDFGDGGTSTVKSPTHTYAAAGTYTVKEAVTDSNAKSNTKTGSVNVSAGGTATQLIVNGTFESGATGWTASAGVICTNTSCQTSESARAGTGYAWLNGYAATHTDTLSQKVAIPAGKASATLSFYLHIDTAETENLAYDTLKVQVLNSAGTVLATLATYSNLNAASGYALRSFNLNAYIGQTVTLRFVGAEDSNLQTSYVIDDVSLLAQ
jgi:xanthomonalisin